MPKTGTNCSSAFLPITGYLITPGPAILSAIKIHIMRSIMVRQWYDHKCIRLIADSRPEWDDGTFRRIGIGITGDDAVG